MLFLQTGPQIALGASPLAPAEFTFIGADDPRAEFGVRRFFHGGREAVPADDAHQPGIGVGRGARERRPEPRAARRFTGRAGRSILLRVPPEPGRVRALDWLRGLVVMLMAVDHASVIYNAGRVAEDSAALFVVGSALPAGQFFTRWITHLCAPGFVLLAGMSIALAGARGRGEGRAVDRHLLVRGFVLVGLELLYMSALNGSLLLQVLYALGVGMIALAFLSRLGARVLLGLALGWMLVDEWVTTRVWDPSAPTDAGSPATALLVGLWKGEAGTILYPALPWLAIMTLGWVLGEHMARWHAGRARWSPARVLALAGAAGLVVFAIVRGLNGYGNMLLLREGDSLVQWLHVSKYPPSLAFVGLEVGLVMLLLAGLLRLEEKMPARGEDPVLVFGQTALFFYLVHWLVLGVPAAAFGLFQSGGAGTAFVAAGAALVVMQPLCRWYRRYKRAHPRGWARYI